MMMVDVIDWLLASGEPWTRYRTRVELLKQPPSSPEAAEDREAILTHPLVRGIFADLQDWPGVPLKRHNDARHPFNKLPVLVDFGLTVEDPGMGPIAERLLSNRSPEGPFQVSLQIHERYGGTGEPETGWSLCDAAVNLYSAAGMGLGDHPAVQKAARHLLQLARETDPEEPFCGGWPCAAGMGFRGPGRAADPCPISTLHALRALDALGLRDHPAAASGVDMLITHWERQEERKLYLFGIGTDFRKLKYPFIWYDILYFLDTLVRFPRALSDPRLQEVVKAVTGQADPRGRYTASSMYRAWKEWSFADKKNPSPWLTFLVLRVLDRTRAA